MPLIIATADWMFVSTAIGVSVKERRQIFSTFTKAYRMSEGFPGLFFFPTDH